jgi:hypothetical protein
MTFERWCETNKIATAPAIRMVAASVQKQLNAGISEPVVTGSTYTKALIRDWLRAIEPTQQDAQT